MHDHSTAVAAEPTIEHPTWCWPGHCEVVRDEESGLFHGRHVGEVRQAAHSWDEVAVCITDNDLDAFDGRSHDDPKIALRIAEPTYLVGVTDDNKWQLGQTAIMEPEEAEMLARWLLKTVGEWREAAK